MSVASASTYLFNYTPRPQCATQIPDKIWIKILGAWKKAHPSHRALDPKLLEWAMPSLSTRLWWLLWSSSCLCSWGWSALTSIIRRFPSAPPSSIPSEFSSRFRQTKESLFSIAKAARAQSPCHPSPHSSISPRSVSSPNRARKSTWTWFWIGSTTYS